MYEGSIQNPATGVFSFPVPNIPVVAGDLIAFYGTGGIVFNTGGSTQLFFQNGNGVLRTCAFSAANPGTFPVGSVLDYTSAPPGAQFSAGCDQILTTFVPQLRTYSFGATFQVYDGNE